MAQSRPARRGHYAMLAALNSHEPVTRLRAIVVAQLDRGIQHDAILAHLEQLRAAARDANDENREEHVMTVMDHLTGWCRPDLALPPR